MTFEWFASGHRRYQGWPLRQPPDQDQGGVLQAGPELIVAGSGAQSMHGASSWKRLRAKGQAACTGEVTQVCLVCNSVRRHEVVFEPSMGVAISQDSERAGSRSRGCRREMGSWTAWLVEAAVAFKVLVPAPASLREGPRRGSAGEVRPKRGKTRARPAQWARCLAPPEQKTRAEQGGSGASWGSWVPCLLFGTRPRRATSSADAARALSSHQQQGVRHG